ncbi:MAG: aldo/keto reductase [Clostridia bacterium]|nr:aldo/keto reductase [Clostridia bacterium]
MKYGRIQYVDRPISRVVFGTAMPVLFGAFRSVYGESPDFGERLDAAFRLLDAMFALGVNCFDCADHYGEEPLGEWLEARGLRDRVVILTKGAHHNRWRKRVTDFDILHDVHNSLAKLKTNRLDMYLLHRDDPEAAVGPLMDALNRCVDEGKLGALGVSNWTIPRIEAANEYAAKHNLRPFTVSSPNFGLAEQVCDLWGGGCVTIAGPENADARAWYARNSVPVFAYSSLARGLFSGRVKSDDPDSVNTGMDAFGVKGYACDANIERLRRCEIMAAQKGLTVPQVAMAWLFNQRALDVYALVSTSRPENMRDNIAASEVALTDAECAWLDLRQETI